MVTPSNYSGVSVSDASSNAAVVSCTISNHSTAIKSYFSRVYSQNNSGTGNTTALSTQGGVITKAGAQPSGATAEYITANSGGIIR